MSLSEKQKLARSRNFNKFRLLGMTLDRKGLTKEEYESFKKVKDKLIGEWDTNSKKLGLNPKKKKDGK